MPGDSYYGETPPGAEPDEKAVAPPPPPPVTAPIPAPPQPESATPELIPPQPEAVREGPVLPDDTTALPTVVAQPEEPEPLGRSWAFDLGKDQFTRIGSQQPRAVFGPATLIVWIDKALHTEQGALPIHPPGYGMPDPFAIFGRPVSELSVQEIERQLTECLTFHPRIAAVAGVELDRDVSQETAIVSFSVQTDPPLDETELDELRLDLGAF